jgi:hypothetical protein
MKNLKVEKLTLQEIERIKRNIKSLLDLNNELRDEMWRIRDINPWYPIHNICGEISGNVKRIKVMQDKIGCKYV